MWSNNFWCRMTSRTKTDRKAEHLSPGCHEQLDGLLFTVLLLLLHYTGSVYCQLTEEDEERRRKKLIVLSTMTMGNEIKTNRTDD